MDMGHKSLKYTQFAGERSGHVRRRSEPIHTTPLMALLMTLGLSQSFKPFKALPRKHLATLALRVGDR
jgi:hypothetical protein